MSVGKARADVPFDAAADAAAEEARRVNVALRALFDILSRTTPGRSNTVEWARIRAGCDALTPYNDDDTARVFGELVELLGGIEPARDNRAEWTAIRNTCAAIKTSTGSPKTKLLTLLLRLVQTQPGRDNIAEWAAIRNVCNDQIVMLTA